ncbi:MAG TPA: glycosyltransferase [Rhodocyclaceae bacterium]|nr:glycosyltransferase [Rhodocyclaceae bacterium]
MRVLMVSDVYFPRVNGVSTAIETYRRTLGAEDVEVRLIAPNYGVANSTAEESWVTRVASRRVPFDPEDRLVRWGAMQRTVAEAAAAADLIHIQTPFAAHYAGLKAARARGVPVLATYHTLFEEYLHHYAPFVPANWLRGLARRFSAGQCNALDAVIVPSLAMEERLRDYGVNRPLHVLPTGIPVNRFAGGDGAAFRQRHGIDPARPVALFVGRVAHEKNIGFLLQAMRHCLRECPEALLLITGEGPAVADLKKQAERLQLGDSVRFLGYLDRASELPDCYAAANVFAFASRTETQGLVLLEAMAAGVPVVGLAEMGTRDILIDAPGSFTPPDDPAAFGVVLAGVLNDRAQWPAWGAAARQHAQGWNESTIAGRLAGVYRQIGETPLSSRVEWKAPTKEKPA